MPVLMPMTPEERRKEADCKRERAFRISNGDPLPEHTNNGEEDEYTEQYGFPVASYSKGLRHNGNGEVEPEPYGLLLKALRSGREEDFASIPQGVPLGRRFLNPQGGLAFDLEGPDAQAVTLPPAPRIDERKNDGEMVELYWMALLRDAPFISYGEREDVAAAARELEGYRDCLDVPLIETLTPPTLFRGQTQGALTGPYISQFLMRDVPLGPLQVSQRLTNFVPRRDYLTDFESWLASQNGAPPRHGDVLDPTPRYIRNLRDLARYVHADPPYFPYLMAAFVLFGMGADPANLHLLLDDGLAYPILRRDGQPPSNQEGFASFGPPALLALLAEVTTRSAKAMWFQKWFVHRRLRPEEYGGRIDVHRREVASYPVSAELLSSQAHERILSRFGSSLLPQAFPEGCPLHPAYGAGHATSAGACATILKAFIQERQRWLGRVVVPNDEGTALVDYVEEDAGRLTIGGELDKLVANISLGRSAAGVHWRTDYTEAIRLGERVALKLLQEYSTLFNEAHHFTVTDFDGRSWRIEDGCINEMMSESQPLSAPA
ncbi:vanadium-dependent haloperoxidase [Stigmatella hybrida]|uniref:vanadium-dependent haloperoxidase n=1 Tax=Stigmatella hybrida TaxID=394097 RepID=UPI001CDAB282|nr:vanadium-dependent haloperoxidase [Stigmatella hybrida]